MNTIKLDKTAMLSGADLDDVVTHLNQGGVVILPTDTSYGMAARVDNEKALRRVFSLKGRPKQKSVSMVVRSRAQAKEYGQISCKPTDLWKAFLPGPLTLVVRALDENFPRQMRREDNTVAIRFIKTPVIMQILKQLDVPLTITSANKTGASDIYSLAEFQKQYKNGKLPDVFVDMGKLKKTKPSTVVRAVKGEDVEILREGPVSKEQIFSAIKSS